MLNDDALVIGARDRLADYETTPMFSDAELKRHILQAVSEFSWYRAAFKSQTITILSNTTHYQLADDCLVVATVYDPDDAVFTGWTQDGQYLVVDATLSDTLATLTVKYEGTHDNSGGSYPTIQTLFETDLLDLLEARCLELMASDMAKRPSFTETQTKINHQDAASQWQRKAVALRWRVATKLNRMGGFLG